jgi:N-acetylmuramic acid 6-phosphate etherase
MTPAEMLALMDREDHRVVAAVAAVESEIAVIAERVAATFREGHRITLLGAGTSGRIAVQEVAELSPTFGLESGVFSALVASGIDIPGSSIAANEDDTAAVAAALSADAAVSNGDIVIGLSASGTTPFVVAGLGVAKRLGAWTVGIANSPDTPVLTIPHLGVLLDTGPEILTGSTRMKAGTAQKIALNRVTTIAMVLAGRVTSNFMTELTGGVDKLRDRAMRIVCELGDVSRERAETALETCGWRVRPALEQVGYRGRRFVETPSGRTPCP